MIDPICGMQVSEPPKIKLEKGGVLYGFCSEGCREIFQKRGENPPAASNKKGYFILAGVFAVIFAFVYARRILAGDWHSAEVMADFMGAFFIIFGAFKLLDLRAFADAYATYDILAAKSRAYAYFYPFLQIVLGAAYLCRVALSTTNIIALCVMALSSIGVAKALASGRKIRCACLGTRIALPMTSISLIEDVLMAIMAAFSLLQSGVLQSG